MRIKRHDNSYVMWLSADDTYKWAHRPNNRWPCSTMSGKRFVICVNSNGLYDLTMNGKSINNNIDIDGTELDACVSSHLPRTLRHLWPTWE